MIDWIDFIKYDWTLSYNMSYKRQLHYNILWLQILLGEGEEEKEESLSEEEDNIILRTALVQWLNTRYLKPRIYHVAKSKHWW